jgi:hypothetical protein
VDRDDGEEAGRLSPAPKTSVFASAV